MKNISRQGFTIVELLIVIVVIGILAAISIVAYGNISNKANDSAVQQDLRNIGNKFTIFHTENGRWPVGNSEIVSTGIKVTKNAYGHNFIWSYNNTEFNLLYCRDPATPTGPIALIGRSKSGKMYAYAAGTVSEFTGRWTGSEATCSDAGAPIPSGSIRDWLFDSGRWISGI